MASLKTLHPDGLPEPVSEGRVTQRLARGIAKQLRHSTEEGVDVAAEYVDAVFVTRRGKVESMNDAAEQLCGYTRDELIGCRLDSLVFPVSHAGALDHQHRVASLHTRDGQHVPVELLMCPTEGDSNVAVIRPADRQSAYLREETIAGLVHDLRTPLSTIALEVCMLDGKVDPSADVRQALARIEHNIDYIDRMVHDLLDAAAMAGGQLELRLRTAELKSLVVEVADRVVSSRDRHRLVLDVPESILARVDEGRIERVIANLISNALKYSPKQSPVIVRLERQAAMACISVIDSGPGIDANEQSHVFDAYRRTTSSARHDHIGLGLYVSRKIVESHGGRIGVESSLEKGSRFYFELPFTAPKTYSDS